MLRAAAYGFEDDEDTRIKLNSFENNYLPRLLQCRYGLQYPLKERLCKAISIRLRRFEYQKAHQPKLDASFTHGSPAPSGKRQAPTRLGEAPSHTDGGERMVYPPALSLLKAPASRLPSTNATPYNPLPAPSIISRESNRSAGSFTRTVGIPEPPHLTGNLQYVPCPYCRILISKDNLDRKTWK